MSARPDRHRDWRAAKRAWSARGSTCPICGWRFRSDACPHSIGQVNDYFDDMRVRSIAAEVKP